MSFRATYLALFAIVSSQLFAQSELSIAKFRFKKYESSKFERLVLEFSGPEMNEEVEVEKMQSGDKQNVTLTLKNVTLVGAIPEGNMNASYQKEREWIGPLSFNVDKRAQSVTVRTFLSKNGSNVDAFWLNNPTRLVIDAYPQNSPRASSRQIETEDRKTASLKMPKEKMKMGENSPVTAKPRKEAEESIYCFPASAQLNPKISFHPWSGSSSIPVKTEKTASLPDRVTENIQCFSGRSRVFPEVFFNKDGGVNAEGAMNKSDSRIISSELLPARPMVSAPASGNSSQPSSLGTKLEPKKGANPTSLLPPLN